MQAMERQTILMDIGIFRCFLGTRIICRKANTSSFSGGCGLSLMISQLTCPTCGTRVLLEETCTMPFCSVRCQQIDLGRWMNEEIRLPVEPDELCEDEEASHS